VEIERASMAASTSPIARKAALRLERSVASVASPAIACVYI